MIFTPKMVSCRIQVRTEQLFQVCYTLHITVRNLLFRGMQLIESKLQGRPRTRCRDYILLAWESSSLGRVYWGKGCLGCPTFPTDTVTMITKSKLKMDGLIFVLSFFCPRGNTSKLDVKEEYGFIN